jgi:hypothetical protein
MICVPHIFAIDTKSKREAARPPSLLRVDIVRSKGPLTGPAPVKRTVLSVARTHPCVLFLPLSPPSVAKRNFFRDLNARHTWMSVAVCFHSERCRRCFRGRVRMWSFSDSNDVEDSLTFSFRPLSECLMHGFGGCFQNGM